MSQRKQHATHRASRRPPASGRKPTGRLTARDIATSADELLAFQAHFDALFARQEQRDWFRFYLCGQLSNLARKTVEPMVLALLGSTRAPSARPNTFWARPFGRLSPSWSTPKTWWRNGWVNQMAS